MTSCPQRRRFIPDVSILLQDKGWGTHAPLGRSHTQTHRHRHRHRHTYLVFLHVEPVAEDLPEVSDFRPHRTAHKFLLQRGAGRGGVTGWVV